MLLIKSFVFDVLFVFVVVDGLLKLPTNITKLCSYVNGLHPGSVRSSVEIRVEAWAQEGLSYEEDGEILKKTLGGTKTWFCRRGLKF